MILDKFGKPFKREADLVEEVGASTVTGVRPSRFDGVASGLSPERLGQILRDAVEGDATEYLTLAEEMEEREPHYASVLGVRKLAVSGLERIVKSPTDEKLDLEITDAVRTLITSSMVQDSVSDLLDGLGKGYSAVEIIWRQDAKRWTPERLKWRDPRFFRFDEAGEELRLRDEAEPDDGLPLQPYKWIVHRPRLKSGTTIRGGLARLAAASYACKSFSLRDWMAFAEVFGMPLRVGRYGANADPAQIRKLISAVANLGHDAAAVIPDSMKIEFVKSDAGSGGPQLYEGLAEWLDRQVSKAVLGQTMTSDDGSSQAQATIHNEVRRDLNRADANQLSATIDRDLIRPFVELNWGARPEYPSVQFSFDESEDLQAFSDAIVPLIDRGLRVEASVIRDKFGLPDPEDGAEVLGPMNAAFDAMNRLALNRRANNRESPRDEMDDLIADELKQWKESNEVFDPLLRAVESATSWDDLQAKLDQAMVEGDASGFVRQFGSALLKARGLGDGRD